MNVIDNGKKDFHLSLSRRLEPSFGKLAIQSPSSTLVMDSPEEVKNKTPLEDEFTNINEEPLYENEFENPLDLPHSPGLVNTSQTKTDEGAEVMLKPVPHEGNLNEGHKLTFPLYHMFPKYRRQYKVESIYVNDLYTLTYDEGETLESLKSIEVIYRRTDREEIRRKLAMGTDDEFHHDRHIKKPSLQSRLQSGKNLQICFMNETASDCESQCSDTESTQDRIDEMEAIISSKECKLSESEIHSMDFISHQARLQAEARLALAQAKEMARMQMEIERQSKKKSPITEIVRDSFNKIGFPFPDSKRRMSRQILTDMNVAQLQVIVNDLHTQIENLNEDLVQLLLGRDDLHMEQDSMLVDIEDLTKHLGAKQRPNMDSEKKGNQISKSDSFQGPVKVSPSSKTLRLKAMVKK